MSTRPSPYRERALKHYSQQQQEVVVPRLISLRLAAVLWIALAVLLVAVVASWFGRIPLFATTSGIVLGQKTGQQAAGMYIFIPASQVDAVQVGMPVLVHIGTSGPAFTTTVESVTKNALAPTDLRRQFDAGSNGWNVVQEPSIVVKIKTLPQLSLKALAGSALTAQIQVGTRPVLALIPGIGQFVGGTK
ncbi:hypothetical protein KDH_13840 [Dictyobacter sp. S3.2.2.5]|uniref:Band 7 domain-containing protein n=1 Tax=Dictyobacter halimunensis TaxID=3026934 RepID=A0ABQ6FLH3_9CHLR|nr:hypothetical protein KDH_13840 [Dictyobacter sp. S3.2.2.5]